MSKFPLLLLLLWTALLPAAEELKLTAPKSTYALGERIEVTVTATNATGHPWQVWFGGTNPSGRLEGITFTTDPNWQTATDPLGWITSFICYGCAIGKAYDLEGFTQTLPLNAYLRFDKPGVYKVSASVNAQSPTAQAFFPLDGKEPLVITRNPMSEPLTLTIVGAAEPDLQALAARARQDTADGRDAIQTLSFLGTPKARDILLDLLATDRAPYTEYPIFALPDREAVADAILARIETGRLMPNYLVNRIYLKMKTGEGGFRGSEDLGAGLALFERIRKVTGGKGPVYYEALLSTYHAVPEPERQAIREEMVRNQLDFSLPQMKQIAQSWGTWGGPDLLPLIREAVRFNSEDALRVLAREVPEEARPHLVADLQRPTSIFSGDLRAGRLRLETIQCLPRQVIPELQPWFQAELAAENPNFRTLIPAIERYGAPDLLPPVVTLLLERPGREAFGRDWYANTVCGYRFWVRVEPEQGALAVRNYVEREDNFGLVEEIVHDEWLPALEPLVGEYLRSENVETKARAARLLAKWAPSHWLDQVLTVAEALPRESDENRNHFRQVTSTIRQRKEWPLTEAQKSRLDALEPQSGIAVVFPVTPTNQ
jgi:hypothetical protein